MNDISKVRFDALASYARHPLASTLATELRWFEFDGERVLATLILDTDGEYSAVVMARDLRERYRWVIAFFATLCAHWRKEGSAPWATGRRRCSP